MTEITWNIRNSWTRALDCLSGILFPLYSHCISIWIMSSIRVAHLNKLSASIIIHHSQFAQDFPLFFVSFVEIFRCKLRIYKRIYYISRRHTAKRYTIYCDVNTLTRAHGCDFCRFVKLSQQIRDERNVCKIGKEIIKKSANRFVRITTAILGSRFERKQENICDFNHNRKKNLFRAAEKVDVPRNRDKENLTEKRCGKLQTIDDKQGRVSARRSMYTSTYC